MKPKRRRSFRESVRQGQHKQKRRPESRPLATISNELVQVLSQPDYRTQRVFLWCQIFATLFAAVILTQDISIWWELALGVALAIVVLAPQLAELMYGLQRRLRKSMSVTRG